MPEHRTRHLAAVVFTDLVGYTALMQRDEAAALRARAEHRSVLQEIIPKHHGQLIQFMGDGSLSLFPSSVSAVAAALEIQRAMGENPTLPLRVGIDEGEVAYDEQGVYGHCVNRASRIEGVALPGSVCVSEKVYQELNNQPTFSGEVIGEFELKNVDAPVRVFRIRDPAERTQPAELLLLGGVSLKLRGEPVSGRSAQRRRMAFLALLSAAPHGVMSRDKVVGYLWPDTDPQKARRLLSEALYVIRKSLGEDSVVATGGELRLNRELVWSDVASYQEALNEGKLATAVELYAGPFVDGFYVDDAIEFDHWVDSTRDRLAREYAEALDTLARRAEAAGDRSEAVRWWRDLIRFDPLDAAVAVRYMEALEGAGRRAEALQFARKHAKLLREEFDAEPNPQVEALAQRLRDSPAPAPVEEKRVPPSAPAFGSGASAGSIPAPAGSPEQETLPTSTEGPATPVPARSRRWKVGLAAAGVVAMGIWGVTRIGGTEPPQTSTAVDAVPVRIAVFPFEGDADLVPLWKDLSDNLDDAGDVTSVAYVNVSALLDWREGGRVGLAAADSLADRLGATHFALSSVGTAEDILTLSLTVYETGHPEEALERPRVSAPADEPLTLVNKMAMELLPALSSNPTELHRFVSRTTESLEAWKAFNEGETAFLRSRFDEAAEAFARSVEIDPAQAWVHYRLSQAYEWNEQYMEALNSAESARERSTPLKSHHRKLIEAWDNLVRGDAERAEELYGEILFTWPNDVEGLLGMVKVLMFHNPRRGRSRVEALGYLNRLLESTPAFGDIHLHLMEFAATRGPRSPGRGPRRATWPGTGATSH